MDISNLSLTELESLAYRLVEQRDGLSNDLTVVQARLKVLRDLELSGKEEAEKGSDGADTPPAE